MSLVKRICEPTGPNANVLIRLVVGGVFLNEGILKFLYPVAQASGRFARIGIPHPEFFGPFVATVEIVCGAMVILGLLTQPAAIALFIDISAAIFTTKIPVLLGHGFLGFTLTFKEEHYGFLSMVHEARTDFSMWFRSPVPAHHRTGAVVTGRVVGLQSLSNREIQSIACRCIG